MDGQEASYTTYEYKGVDYELSSDLTPDEALGKIKSYLAQSSSGDMPETVSVTQYDGSLAKQDRTWSSTLFGEITEEDLQYDPRYVEAGRLLWKATNTNSDAELSDKEAAEYATNMQGWFAYNLPRQALDVSWLQRQNDETRKAFLYTMDKYEYLGFSWRGVDRFITGMVADPTNYAGLATLGFGTVAGTATKVASRAALRHALRTGVTMAVESAVTSGADAHFRQRVGEEAGVREYSLGNTALGAVGGAVLGGALGGAGSLTGTLVRGITKDVKAPSVKGTLPPEAMPNPVEPPEVKVSAEVVPDDPDQLGLPMDMPPTKPRKTEAEQVAEDALQELPWNKDQLNLGLDNPNATDNPIIRSVKENAPDSGAKLRVDLKNGIQPTRDVILGLDEDELGKVVNEALHGELNPEGQVLLGRSLKEATDELMAQVRNAPSIPEAYKVEQQLTPIRNASNLLATQASDALRSYQGGPNIAEFRKVSVDSILEERKLTRETAEPDALESAMQEFQKRIAAQDRVIEAQPKVKQMTDEVERLVEKGDIAEAIQRNAEKEALMDRIADDTGIATGERKTWKAMQFLDTLGRGAVEVSISNVMSARSIWRNIAPTMYDTLVNPALYAVQSGFTGPARARAMTHYATLLHSRDYALKAAMAAYRYETQVLPMKHRKGQRSEADVNRFTEMRPVIPRKFGGGIVRLFPRLTNTTDEFFSQLNYRAFVAGDIAARAWDEGEAKGLTGKSLKDFVKNKVEVYEKHSYEQGSTDSIISFLRKMGVENGLSGKKLDDWIATRLTKDKDVLRVATSQVGLNVADDLAYRKVFSGENWISRLANTYQEVANNSSMLRLSGQLFFKTPVRVFQTGVRLTPGVQVLDPSFIRDLTGKGAGGEGGPAQMRAYSQAMMSTVWLTTAMMLFADGRLTGAGYGEDYKQMKSAQNPDFEPYTLRIGDWKFNYQYYEPFATPLKILANSMEKLEMLEYRKAQGEDVAVLSSETATIAQTAAMGVVQAIDDASLWEGLSQLMELGKNLVDPDGEDALTKWFGQKLQMFVPSTITHAQQAFFGDGSKPDNAALDDFIVSKLNPYSPGISRIHGPVGNIVKNPQGIGAFLGISMSSPETQTTGDPQLDRVMKGMADLTLQTGKNWIAPYKAQAWAAGTPFVGLDFDLRKRMTSDGTETMYDRIQRYTFESGVVQQIDTILSRYGNVSAGTPTNKGVLVDVVNKVLTTYRRAAFLKLMQEEDSFLPMTMDALGKKQRDMTGPNMPSLFKR